VDPETELFSLAGSNNKQNQSGGVADPDPRRFGKPNRIRMKSTKRIKFKRRIRIRIKVKKKILIFNDLLVYFSSGNGQKKLQMGYKI
jgi:hypothetical protein